MLTFLLTFDIRNAIKDNFFFVVEPVTHKKFRTKETLTWKLQTQNKNSDEWYDALSHYKGPLNDGPRFTSLWDESTAINSVWKLFNNCKNNFKLRFIFRSVYEQNLGLNNFGHEDHSLDQNHFWNKEFLCLIKKKKKKIVNSYFSVSN